MLVEWIVANWEILLVIFGSIVGLRLYLGHLERIARYEEDQRTERTRLNTQARERIALAEGNALQYGFNEAPQADTFSVEGIMQLLSNPAVSQMLSQFMKGKEGQPPSGGTFLPASETTGASSG